MLAEGLESIAAQSFRDWELIIVDDGSTDRNGDVVEEFRQRVPQTVTYLFQENRGPGVARQRGLEAARGEYIAYMDSDDPWLPHHLADCVAALDSHADVDWITAPARVINELTSELVHENSFWANGIPRPFLNWDLEQRGELSVLMENDLLTRVIREGFPGGLQTSVFRRWIAERVHFRPYRLFDDVAFQLEAIAAGARPAFFRTPHVIYRIHDQNLSLVNTGPNEQIKREGAVRDGLSIFAEIESSESFPATHRWLIRERRANLLQWDLAHGVYATNGHHAQALRAATAAVRLCPHDWKRWKSLAGFAVRATVAGVRKNETLKSGYSESRFP